MRCIATCAMTAIGYSKPWDDDALRTSVAEAFRYHWLMRNADDAPE